MSIYQFNDDTYDAADYADEFYARSDNAMFNCDVCEDDVTYVDNEFGGMCPECNLRSDGEYETWAV